MLQSRANDCCCKQQQGVLRLFYLYQAKEDDLRSSSFAWCEKRDLNPYGVNHTPLKRARLPVPPLSHVVLSTTLILYTLFTDLSIVFLKFFEIFLIFLNFLFFGKTIHYSFRNAPHSDGIRMKSVG